MTEQKPQQVLSQKKANNGKIYYDVKLAVPDLAYTFSNWSEIPILQKITALSLHTCRVSSKLVSTQAFLYVSPCQRYK